MNDLSDFVPMDILVKKSRTAYILLLKELHMTLILTRQDVQQVLDMRACIEAIAEVMQLFSAGDTVMPVRLVRCVLEQGVHAACWRVWTPVT